MVSYMWGKDVADDLLATEAVSEDCEAVMGGMGRDYFYLPCDATGEMIAIPGKEWSHDCPDPDASLVWRAWDNYRTIIDNCDDAPKLDDAWAAGAARFLPSDPNDEYDFDVSAADIYESMDRRRARLYRMAAGLRLDNPQATR